MNSEIIGKKLRFVLVNNFHYTGTVIDVNDREIVIIDTKGVRVTLAKHSIIILEETNGN